MERDDRLLSIPVFIGIVFSLFHEKSKKDASLWKQVFVASCPFTIFYLAALFSSIHPSKPTLFHWLSCLSLLGITVIGGVKYGKLQPKNHWKVFRLSWQQVLLFGIGAFYVTIQLADINVSPIWDAGLYYNALLKGVFSYDFTLPSFVSSFSAYRHPSHLLMMLYASGQYIFPGKIWALNGTTILLSLVMFYCYYKISVKLLSPKGAVAATCFFVAAPSILAFTIGINPDFGLLLGLVFLLYSYAYSYKILTVFSMLLLLFSKEPGLLICLGFGLGIVLFQVWPRTKGQGIARFFQVAFKNNWYLLIPLFIFFVYAFSHGLKRVSSDLLFKNDNRGFMLNFLHLKTIFLQIFVLNFQWIFTLVAIIGIFAIPYCGKLREKNTHSTPNQSPLWGIVLTILACYIVFNLFYVEIELLRYTLPIIAFLPIICCYGGEKIPLNLRVKKASCTILFILLLTANYKTIDPISLFTFPYKINVGEYSLLDMARRDGTPYICEIHIYNRQYLEYSRLLDDIIYDYGAEEGQPYASWNIPEYSLQFFGNAEEIYRLQYSPEQQKRVFYAKDMILIPGREYMPATLEEGIFPPANSLWIATPPSLTGEENIIQEYKRRGMILYLTTSPLSEISE